MTQEEQRDARKRYLVAQVALLGSVRRAVNIQRERLVRVFPGELHEGTAIMAAIDALGDVGVSLYDADYQARAAVELEFPEQGGGN